MPNINDFMLLTQQKGILKPFAIVLGYILEGIFWVLNKFGIPNIALAIIIFTVIIYVLLLPLTIKQQKFSKLSAKMNPELQAIRKKYEGKNQDQEAMQRMQQETNAVYAKYGVNPSGSCIQLLIQMPILFALYRVIYNMPAYVGQIKDVFMNFVPDLVKQNGSAEFIQSLSSASYYSKQFSNESFGVVEEYTQNTYIDVLNRSSSADWAALQDKFTSLSDKIADAYSKLSEYNNFFGLNIANSPSFVLKGEWAMPDKNWGVIIGVLMIPILACVTQWINTKLMPQQASQGSGDKNDNAEAMMQSMKTMNTVMPLMSAVFAFTLPIGMGIYWIAGAVVRGIIQICINKKLDKIDIDEMVKKNLEKVNEKRAKAGLPPQQINANATINTRNVDKKPATDTNGEKAARIKESTDYYKNANIGKEGSLASKAFMVKQFNEKNSNNKEN